jgi:hypothetical protein
MKQSILLYLCILFVLTNIFTYAFLSSQVKFEQTNYDNLNKKFTDTVNSYLVKVSDADYFSLEKDDKAQVYFENKGGGNLNSVDKIIPYVQEKLLDLNSNPNGNPYTGYEKVDGKRFIINKMKFLNHRWIIADFNNGTMWGEVILKYFLNPDNTVSFEIVETTIYPQQ